MKLSTLYPSGHTRALRAIERRLDEEYRQLGPEITAEIAARALVLVDQQIKREREYLETFCKPRRRVG